MPQEHVIRVDHSQRPSGMSQRRDTTAGTRTSSRWPRWIQATP